MSRKIEQQMIEAIRAGKSWKSGNTEVAQVGAETRVTLHGNLIAVLTDEGSAEWSLAGWNTPTTRSRINALARAFNWRGVSTKGGNAFVGGSATRPFKVIRADEWVQAF